jgi:hypothetical protein
VDPFEALGIDTSEIDDGTQVLNLEAAAEEIGILSKTFKSLSATLKKAGKENKTVAYHLLKLAMNVVNAAGYPVMSMETGKASEYVKRVSAALYDTYFPIPSGENVSDAEKAEARKMRSNSLTAVRLWWGGRKGVGGMRECFATAYVMDNIGNYKLHADDLQSLQKPGFLKWSDPDPDFPDLFYLKTVPQFLKAPIAELYKQSGLDVPEKFGGPKKGGNDKDTKSKKVTATQFQTTVAEGIVRFNPLVIEQSIEAAVKAGVRQVLSVGGEIEGREEIRVLNAAIIKTLELYQAHLDSKITPEQREQLDAIVAVPDIMAVLKDEVEPKVKTTEKVAA